MRLLTVQKTYPSYWVTKAREAALEDIPSFRGDRTGNVEPNLTEVEVASFRL